MVSVDTRLNENSHLILYFFFIAFILGEKTNCLIMELIVSFPDVIEVSLGQLKRFNESVIDRKFLLKVEATSFYFDKVYPFQATLYFLAYCEVTFIEKYGLHAFQNSLELQSTLSFSKYCNLACLFRFATRFRCRLNLTM